MVCALGTGRIVVGDSWFGSVKTCIQLLKLNGLYFIGLVKTAHKGYPKEKLREAEKYEENGSLHWLKLTT